MNSILSENTKLAAYLLWEETKSSNALNLWYCCESIAFYFEGEGILTDSELNKIICKSKYDPIYIDFVRNVSYRVYQSTGETDSIKNWYCTEKLLNNIEWRNALIKIATEFRNIRNGKSEPFIRSEWIKRRL